MRPNICDNHKRFKKDTWKCLRPDWCKFAKQLAPKPDAAKKDQKD